MSVVAVDAWLMACSLGSMFACALMAWSMVFRSAYFSRSKSMSRQKAHASTRKEVSPSDHRDNDCLRSGLLALANAITGGPKESPRSISCSRGRGG